MSIGRRLGKTLTLGMGTWLIKLRKVSIKMTFRSIQCMQAGRNSNKNKSRIPIMKASVTPCHTNEEPLNCWKEDFQQALNLPLDTHFPDFEEEAPIAGVDVTVCGDPPSQSDVHRASQGWSHHISQCSQYQSIVQTSD